MDSPSISARCLASSTTSGCCRRPASSAPRRAGTATRDFTVSMRSTPRRRRLPTPSKPRAAARLGTRSGGTFSALLSQAARSSAGRPSTATSGTKQRTRLSRPLLAWSPETSSTRSSRPPSCGRWLKPCRGCCRRRTSRSPSDLGGGCSQELRDLDRGVLECSSADSAPTLDQLATRLVGLGVVQGEHSLDHAVAEVEHRELQSVAVAAPHCLSSPEACPRYSRLMSYWSDQKYGSLV